MGEEPATVMRAAGRILAARSITQPQEVKRMKLDGKIAVVTGASKGIGAGIAKGLAAAGATVVVNYASSKADADAVVAHI